eukprot:1373010-Rhodomonas_salina.1
MFAVDWKGSAYLVWISAVALCAWCLYLCRDVVHKYLDMRHQEAERLADKAERQAERLVDTIEKGMKSIEARIDHHQESINALLMERQQASKHWVSQGVSHPDNISTAPRPP